AMLRLEFNRHLGRLLRMDDIDTIGRSTYSLIEEAIREGRRDEVLQLTPYYVKELQIMHEILMVWAQDIMRYMIARDTGTENEVADRLSSVICKTWRDFELGVAPARRLEAAIRAGHEESALQALDRLWLEFKVPH